VSAVVEARTEPADASATPAREWRPPSYWPFVIPALVVVLAVIVFPWAFTIWMSLNEWKVGSPTIFVGFANYLRLPGDPRFVEAVAHTLVYTVLSVVLPLVFGTFAAVVFHANFKGRGVLMTLMLIPMMLSPVVVALFWYFMMRADTGVLNYFIRDVLHLSEKGVFWLTDLKVAMWSVILVDVWMWTPFMMLISLAGLSAVPKYLYEAADVDRASAWFKFRHITLPIIAPLILIGVLFRTIDSYKLFDTVYVLTGGGPGRSTQVLSVYLYQLAFREFDTGKGSALGYIMLVGIIALANLLIRVLNGLRAET